MLKISEEFIKDFIYQRKILNIDIQYMSLYDKTNKKLEYLMQNNIICIILLVSEIIGNLGNLVRRTAYSESSGKQ